MLNAIMILRKKILNLKLVTMLEFQNIKSFSEKIHPNWSEEVFVVSKIKNTVPWTYDFWTYLVSDLNGEEITGSFCEKESLKPSQEEFRIEKVLKQKDDKLYVK